MVRWNMWLQAVSRSFIGWSGELAMFSICASINVKPARRLWLFADVREVPTCSGEPECAFEFSAIGDNADTSAARRSRNRKERGSPDPQQVGTDERPGNLPEAIPLPT